MKDEWDFRIDPQGKGKRSQKQEGKGSKGDGFGLAGCKSKKGRGEGPEFARPDMPGPGRWLPSVGTTCMMMADGKNRGGW